MMNQTVFAERLVSLREGRIVLTSIKVCHQRLSTCYGCGQLLKTSGSVASHLDVVVVSKLRWKYFKDGERHSSNKASNVYFKVHGCTFQDEFRCVLQKFAESQITMDKQKIQPHGEALSHFTAEQKTTTADSFWLYHLTAFLWRIHLLFNVNLNLTSHESISFRELCLLY